MAVDKTKVSGYIINQEAVARRDASFDGPDSGSGGKEASDNARKCDHT